MHLRNITSTEKCSKRILRWISIRKLYSRKSSTKPKKYTNTILLPSTSFPSWVNSEERVVLDAKLNQEYGFKQAYQWQRENVHGPEFIFHDGPPYANGATHIGHAINKLLKDIQCRHKLLRGHKIHYKPGWDCHGLPIELKALSASENSNWTNMDASHIRQLARKFAEDAIVDQRNDFKKWGILADWDNGCYYTFDKKYVQNQIRQFYELFKKGLVYRDMKPVFWSPSSRTALAESELEYVENHQSRAVTLRIKLDANSVPDILKGASKEGPLYVLIWTTTPWTLPANEAIAFGGLLPYSLVKIANEDGHYIVASHMIESLSKKLERNIDVLSIIPASTFDNVNYEHPFHQGRKCRLLRSSHVVANKGTGFVHTAPAHGPDDFLLGIKHNLSMKCIVDETGCYTEEAGQILQGLPVLEEGCDAVLNHVSTNVINEETFTHSYPYDWRTKKPVILRASMQWFLDTNTLKQEAIDSLKCVKITPKSSGERLISQLNTRPYWCISRQRVWGVPIPVFYDNCTQQPLISEKDIENYCQLIDNHGTDFWWTCTPEQLNPDRKNAEKGKDILDIWLDSGLSWSAVLGSDAVADVYLEGIDQCNGWFQSSLMTSIALRKKAPFKKIFVHGFAVDQNGLKMSKSVGNVISPKEILEGVGTRPAYGIDVLRWWVASHSTQHSHIPVTENALLDSKESVQKLRFTLKFLLGVTSDFHPKNEPEMRFLDRYMLNKLYDFYAKTSAYYDDFHYNKACLEILDVVSNEISANYCHLVKDRLYCDAKNSPSRIACQVTCLAILEVLLKVCAPIVPHLAEEVHSYSALRKDDTFFHQRAFRDLPLEWKQPDTVALMNEIMEIKKQANILKPPKLSMMKMNGTIFMTPSLRVLKKFSVEELNELFQMASVNLAECNENDAESKVELTESEMQPCQRCRLYYCTDPAQELCDRCFHLLQQFDVTKDNLAAV